MRPFTLLFLLLTASISSYAQDLKATNLKCEHMVNPVGIEQFAPVLSWELVSGQRNVLQKAYRILVADSEAMLAKNLGNVWDSKKITSAQSIEVPYGGRKLQPAKRYYWKVMVWDNHHQQSVWATAQEWQTGLYVAADWKGADWIAYEVMPDTARILPEHEGKRDKNGGTVNDILPLLRKEIKVSKKVKNATLFISGLGHFELRINGKKIGDHFLDPGWTNYEKQALYVAFDVTDAIKEGDNAIGVLLGNGFYYIPKQKKRFRKLLVQYGYPKMICRLQVNYADGTSEDILSNESWKATAGPLTFSSIYGGEDYDAGREQQGWDMPMFDDRDWAAAKKTNGPPQLNAQAADPLKIFEVFQPQKITKINAESWVYDLGQNASGIVRMTVQGKKGDTVRITPAELLNTDGTVNQKATGRPFYFTYVLKGDGPETWEPRFTYYGFRYVQVEGAMPVNEPAKANVAVIHSLQGLHTRNAAAHASTFNSSDTLFNRTAKLIDWAVRSNMASVFTDCPHREKLGWLEQLHLMGSSLRYTYHVQNLLRKSVSDMHLSQLQSGLVPEISPEFTVFNWGGDMFRDSPEWGSSSIILPWYMYEWYGNKEVVTTAYPMMKKYVSYLETKAKEHILSQGLGDWYDLGPKPPGVSQLTPMGLTGTAIYYYDLVIIQKAAKLLGHAADAAHYQKLAEKVKVAFNGRFFNAQTKNYGSGSQTANAMAVYMKLVDSRDKAAVVENIIADIRKHNNSLTSGDIGYRYLLRVLEDEGRSDVIFEMNNREDVPGYGYQLAQGATALTESWQALPGVSNNHLMLGHLLEWFYSGIGGIRQLENSVAFKSVRIHPETANGITHAETSYHSPYGRIATAWKKEKDSFNISIAIPANTSALVEIPALDGEPVTEGGRLLKNLTYKNGFASISVGSGSYSFKVLKNK